MRQVGGALGVAVIGSAMALVYRHNLDGLLGGPRPGARRHRIGIDPGDDLLCRGGSATRALALAAKQAYVHAMHVGAVASAAFAVLAALVVLKWIPGPRAARRRQRRHRPRRPA